MLVNISEGYLALRSRGERRVCVQGVQLENILDKIYIFLIFILDVKKLNFCFETKKFNVEH